MKFLLSCPLALAVWFIASSPIHATDAAPDNSANNAADRSTEAITPEKQSNEKQDVDITRAIRRAVVKDSTLSIYAHNIKIITTKDHVVYLRGAVSSSDDIGKIAALAEKNSGGYPVKNQLAVSTK